MNTNYKTVLDSFVRLMVTQMGISAIAFSILLFLLYVIDIIDKNELRLMITGTFMYLICLSVATGLYEIRENNG